MFAVDCFIVMEVMLNMCLNNKNQRTQEDSFKPTLRFNKRMQISYKTLWLYYLDWDFCYHVTVLMWVFESKRSNNPLTSLFLEYKGYHVGKQCKNFNYDDVIIIFPAVIISYFAFTFTHLAESFM